MEEKIAKLEELCISLINDSTIENAEKFCKYCVDNFNDYEENKIISLTYVSATLKNAEAKNAILHSDAWKMYSAKFRSTIHSPFSDSTEFSELKLALIKKLNII